jgi:ABC-type uncharacterized transport system permease subunit
VNKDLFIIGGILFVIGLVTGDWQAKIFMTGIGLVFMAAGLGTEACEELFDDFRSIFDNLTG